MWASGPPPGLCRIGRPPCVVRGEANIELDSGARLDSRLRRSGRPIPVRLGTERVGKELDEGTRLRGKEAAVRVHRVDSHVARKGIAREERDERAIFELLAHVPSGLERNAQTG